MSALLVPGNNRFTALRSFELYSCRSGENANPTCDGAIDGGRTKVVTSPSDTFPSVNPRPVAPDMTLRYFDASPQPPRRTSSSWSPRTNAPARPPTRVTRTPIRRSTRTVGPAPGSHVRRRCTPASSRCSARRRPSTSSKYTSKSAEGRRRRPSRVLSVLFLCLLVPVRVRRKEGLVRVAGDAGIELVRIRETELVLLAERL